MAVSTLTLALGCDVTSCTDAGCDTTIDIVIEGPNSGALPDSTYEIVVDVAGSIYSTVCSTSPGTSSCEPAEGAGPFELDIVVTNNGVILGQVRDQSNSMTPATVGLTVIAGDAPLVDEMWDVEYETIHPNGEDCSPTCSRATEVLTAVVDLGEM
ncbi:MAG: hypothetical protein K0V04_00660 [Deltaproteobacteria bacterium]|nr:hypothetical protein [Deltaproteobacteria bacterium]